MDVAGARAQIFRRWLQQPTGRYVLLWGYLSALCFAWAYITATADFSALSTFFAYAPRWVWGVPFLASAFMLRRPSVVERLPLLAGLLVVAGPVMGLSAPNWSPFPAVAAMEHRAGASAGHATHLRVMTVNMGSRLTDPRALAELVATVRPDVVLLQECSERADTAFEGAWHYRDDDALCVASRYPLSSASALYRPRRPQNDAFVAHYGIDVAGRRLDVVNVHLDTPRDAFLGAMQRRSLSQMDAILSRRARQVQLTRAWVEARVDARRVIVAGDFNLTVDSAVYRDVWGDFDNAFSQQGLGWGFTKRSGVLGARIDHVLAGRDWHVRAAWLDRSIGSDHLPLVADLTLPLTR